MIRVRDTSGVPSSLPPGSRFVELMGDDGMLACVVYQDARGVLVVAKPGSTEFEGYTRMFKITNRAQALVNLGADR